MAASSGRKITSSNKKTAVSTAKNSRRAKTSAQRKKAEAQQRAQDNALFHEIGLIVLFAVMALLFCCNFGFIGPVGNTVSGVLFGIFGLTAYAAPVLLFLAVAFWFANEGNHNALRKLIAGIVLFLMLGVICDLITRREEAEAGYQAIQLFEECRDKKAGGGILAGSISFLLKNYLGAIGAVLVVIVCSVVCLILLTEKSLFDSLKQGGNLVREFSREETERRREYAQRRREDTERRREQNRIRRQEQEEERARREEERRLREEEIENEKILRMEKKVSGVMMDATLLKRGKNSSQDDMHEIILPEEVVQEAVREKTVREEAVREQVIQQPDIVEDEVRQQAIIVKSEPDMGQDMEPAFEQWDMPDLPIRIHREGVEETEYLPEQEQLEVQDNGYSYQEYQIASEFDMDGQGNSMPEQSGYPSIISDNLTLPDQETATSEEKSFYGQDIVHNDSTPAAEASSEKALTTESMSDKVVTDTSSEAISTIEVMSDRMPVTSVSPERTPVDTVSSMSDRVPVASVSPERTPAADTMLTSGRMPSVSVSPVKSPTVGTVPGKVSAVAARPVAASPTREQTSGSAAHEFSMEGMPPAGGVQSVAANGQEIKAPKQYMFPPISLLQKGVVMTGESSKELKETAMHLQQTLATFGVKVTITDISQGPSVTRYELQPEQGVKVSKIVSLTDDIKLNLAAMDIRIEAPIPGKAAIGIEVPNKESIPVALRDLLETEEFRNFPSNLAFAVGKDIAGKVIVADIAKMPHMLIAGATGSGKSVCINTLIMGILYKAHPDDVKLIMVDPKVVELSVYNGIPHLLIPVVTDPKKASAALHWGVAEMDDRYKKFAELNVRDLKGYNKKVEALLEKGESNVKKLPQIVIIVDELADLMMVCPGEVEESICRLAQLARAAGIHLIIATQRPSVDVITGLIKANMPSRVAFSVSSGVDSRTILDMVGAEKLLGKGDMLFYPQGYAKPARVQGAFVSDNEVSDVVDFMKNQTLGNTYAIDIEEKIKNMGSSSGGASSSSEVDDLFERAGRLIIDKDKASIGMLQRALQIGFNRAARIMDQLYSYGVVGEEEGTKPRKILMSPEQFEQLLEEV